ncbi:MAG: ATP-binding protein [Candidatus Lokiarchaeota archaeon]|nr:ATP-binding protein [Candidatus Harpocratesius repetitus]
MIEISEYMIRANPWWKDPSNFNLDFKYRDIFQEIEKYLPMKQIIALIGLRRVGKTMIMKKIIQNEISKGFSTQHILYFSFDEFQNKRLELIISEFENLTEVNCRNEKIILILDEIQKMENWENQIKTFYDLYPKMKIILSGSESLFIQKSSKETLAGRLFLFKVEPLTFSEYLTFKGKQLDNYSPISLYIHELQSLWQEFLQTQGFPELVGIKDKEIIKKYLEESLLEKILFKEIPYTYNIRDISLLESLLKLIYNNPGQIIEPSNLAADLGRSRQTISQYLSYLENSFLIRKIYNFSRDQRKIERKKKRYYPSIVSVDLVFGKDIQSKSRIFEWMVVKLLQAEFFWRNTQQNEVDAVIISKNKEILPFEIKFGKIHTKGIEKFMKQFNLDKGFIISWKEERTIMLRQTKNHEIRNKTIFVVPAIKYFLFKDRTL